MIGHFGSAVRVVVAIISALMFVGLCTKQVRIRTDKNKVPRDGGWVLKVLFGPGAGNLSPKWRIPGYTAFLAYKSAQRRGQMMFRAGHGISRFAQRTGVQMGFTGNAGCVPWCSS